MSANALRLPLVMIFCGAAVLAPNMGIRQTFGLFLGPMPLDFGLSRSNFALPIAVLNLSWGLLTPVCGMLSGRL